MVTNIHFPQNNDHIFFFQTNFIFYHFSFLFFIIFIFHQDNPKCFFYNWNAIAQKHHYLVRFFTSNFQPILFTSSSNHLKQHHSVCKIMHHFFLLFFFLNRKFTENIGSKEFELHFQKVHWTKHLLFWVLYSTFSTCPNQALSQSSAS